MSLEEFKYEYDLESLQTITPQNRDFKMMVTPRYLHHYLKTSHEDYSADLLLNLSKDGMLFIDIGAHYGFYTLLVGIEHENTRIIAFEPVPENYKILKKNLELNRLRNVEAYNLAISNKNEIKQFNITEASDSCGFYQHRLTQTVKEIEVQTVALDNFLKDVPKVTTVIKIDTEGHEISVLEGMGNILTNTEDIKLIIEFNPKMLTSAGYQPENLLEKLNQLGFEVYFIDDEERKTYKLDENDLDNWGCYVGNNNYINVFCTKKEKSLSVCLFSHSSHLAGAERSLLELTTELIRDHGVICSVVLPNDGRLGEKLKEVGASTLLVDYSWWCDSSLPPKDEEISRRLNNSFKTLLKQMKELDKINPDVIITNTMVIPWGAISASFLGKPHVWYITEFGKLDHDLKFYLPFKRVLNIIRDSSNLILTISNAVARTLFGDDLTQNILTVYNYIDVPSSDFNSDANNYFTRTNAIRLLISGTITESKGQEDAIMAVKELVLRKKDVELIIMGSQVPWYVKRLKEIVMEEKLEGYVRFMDFRENPFPIMNAADIVLVCSRCEAFGRITVEAMLLKKPVIGTNSGGTVELIKNGFNGLLYEHGNYHQLAEKIEYLIDNRQKIKEFGENGYKFAKENFTKEKYGGRVYELLKGLKNKGNPSLCPLSQFVQRLELNYLQAVAERDGQRAFRRGFLRWLRWLRWWV